MIQETKKVWGAYQAAKNGHSLALMEGPTGCNRRCAHCDVWKRGNNQDASTISGTFEQIDWLWEQGFRVLNYVGGEPLAGCQVEGGVITARNRMMPCGKFALLTDYREQLAPYTTQEEITYIKHTLKVIEYASRKGMFTNVTTNGDFLDSTYFLPQLKKAGLDFLTFSLHSYNEVGLRNIISKARATANEGIVPIVSVVFTSDRADTIPQYARTCAANGILFSTAVVQEIGGGFSATPAESKIPTIEQQKAVFESLLPFKRAGFIRNSLNYLTKAGDFPGNSWRCDPEKDAFIHIRAKGEKGEVGVCSEIRTGFGTNEISLSSAEWRRRKRELVEKCNGCLYSCFYESENSDLRSDLRTFLNMVLVKLGHAGIVRKLGEYAVGNESDVIPIPQSKLETNQASLKEYFNLRNKAKRKGEKLLRILEVPFALAFGVSALGLLYLQARRKKVNFDDVTQMMLAGTVYPGIFDQNEDKKCT